jgi:hypothetical protein
MDRTRRATCTLSECRTPPADRRGLAEGGGGGGPDDASPAICNIPFAARPKIGPIWQVLSVCDHGCCDNTPLRPRSNPTPEKRCRMLHLLRLDARRSAFCAVLHPPTSGHIAFNDFFRVFARFFTLLLLTPTSSSEPRWKRGWRHRGAGPLQRECGRVCPTGDHVPRNATKSGSAAPLLQPQL